MMLRAGFDDFKTRDDYRAIADQLAKQRRLIDALRAAGYTVRATAIWRREIVRRRDGR